MQNLECLAIYWRIHDCIYRGKGEYKSESYDMNVQYMQMCLKFREKECEDENQ